MSMCECVCVCVGELKVLIVPSTNIYLTFETFAMMFRRHPETSLIEDSRLKLKKSGNISIIFIHPFIQFIRLKLNLVNTYLFDDFHDRSTELFTQQ